MCIIYLLGHVSKVKRCGRQSKWPDFLENVSQGPRLVLGGHPDEAGLLLVEKAVDKLPQLD